MKLFNTQRNKMKKMIFVMLVLMMQANAGTSYFYNGSSNPLDWTIVTTSGNDVYVNGPTSGSGHFDGHGNFYFNSWND